MKNFFTIASFLFFGFTAMAQDPEESLISEGIILPVVPRVAGNYSSFVKSGNLIYLSGRGPLQPDGKYTIGKLGKDLNIQQGYAAARLCAIAQLAVLKQELGDLSKLKRIIKVTGFVNGTDSFIDQPKVANGFSDFMVEVFGNKGIHARSAVGVSGLPSGWPVEFEMIVEIKE